jgi:hypothetical protein
MGCSPHIPHLATSIALASASAAIARRRSSPPAHRPASRVEPGAGVPAPPVRAPECRRLGTLGSMIMGGPSIGQGGSESPPLASPRPRPENAGLVASVATWDNLGSSAPKRAATY